MPRKRKEQVDFEKALEELEGLVEKLEAGDLTLEASLQLFERGIALTRSCQHALKEAEQKVQILLNQEGKPELANFESESP